MRRRSVIAAIALRCLVFGGLAVSLAAAPPSLPPPPVGATEFETRPIYHSPQTPGYTAWTTLWRNPKGELRLAFQQVTGPVEPWEQRKNVTVILGSADEAATWKPVRDMPARTNAGSAGQGIYAAPGSSAFCGHGLVALADGTLVTGLWPDPTQENTSGYIQRSTDEGLTWSAPIYLRDPETYKTYPTQIRQLRDGRLVLVAGTVKQADAKTAKYLLKEFFESRDAGKTWSHLWTMPADVGLCEESDFVELDNGGKDGGDLLFIHRAEHYDGNTYVSSDRLQNTFRRKGDGWDIGPVHKVPMPHSGFPELLKMPDGSILHIGTDGVWHTGANLHTWTRLDLPGSPYYPRATLLKDGRVFVVGHVGGDDEYGKVDQTIVGQTFRVHAPRRESLHEPINRHAIPERDVIAIGDRIEMFVDSALIERMAGTARLQLHAPIKREVVLTLDQPWESNSSTYYTLLRDGEKIRLYYRGVTTDDGSERQTTCLAESADGIHFTRPNLGLHEWNGSKENNIVFVGPESAAFAPFLDANPAAPAAERYKAVAFRVFGDKGGVMALTSPDGIRWKRMQETPILPPGTFDSLNTAFWDESIKSYRLYGRNWIGGDYVGVRGIQSSTSADFRTWSDPKPNEYAAGVPLEHFYTNAVVPCPAAPHHLLSFPMRFVPDRKKVPSHKEDGVSDAVFMSSRDGVRWDRSFLQAWVRPGLDERNWTDRSNMPAWGILQLDPSEFSMYLSEHYWWPDNRLRRMTIRRHGFGSLHAGYEGGEVITRPLTFAGKQLLLNYSTSAVGSVQVEIQDAKTGQPLPGYTLGDMAPLFGDELDAPARWKGQTDLSALVGKPVRFRFVLKDADIFAIQTTSAP